jgi:Aerotolerance regulator N-terminal/CARDB/von Willebrand factor type A domain
VSFANGLFLWALPLAAVPVVIHLLQRRRKVVVPWGAMQLLFESVPRKRRLWQINDLLLMVLRTLVIAAVVLAFSRPLVSSGFLSRRTPARDVILIVDSSLSTGRMINGAPVFNLIKEKAGEVLGRLDSNDRARLIVAASMPHWIEADQQDGTASKESIAREIAALKPTLAAADMAACVQAAVQAEATADAASRLIVVLTDGAANGWSAAIPYPWQRIREAASNATVPTTINVVVPELPKSPITNLSVEKLAINRTRVAGTEPFSVTATVRNTGTVSSPATQLKWSLDGRVSGESSVAPLEPAQSVDVSFEARSEHTGPFSVSAQLARDDDLAGDNSGSIVVEALDRLPILICRNGESLTHASTQQPDFLSAALGRDRETTTSTASGCVFEPTVIDVDMLRDSDLSTYRCVVLEDCLPKSPRDVDALTDYVAKGHGLWLILGERVAPEQFNSLFFRDGDGLSAVSIGPRVTAPEDQAQFFSVHPPEGVHPATLLLGDTARLDIDDVRIARHWRLSSPEVVEDAATLLETGAGAPLAIERYFGDGRAIVQAIPFDTKWSNLPVCQVFVPLVHEWLWYLTQPTCVTYNLDPGAPIRFPLPSARGQQQVRVENPLGETITRDAATLASQNQLRFRETIFPGSYSVTVAGAEGSATRLPFWVTRDPNESRLDLLSLADRDALTQSGGLHFVADPLAVAGAAPSAAPSESFWIWLICLVPLLFLTEMCCSRLLTARRYRKSVEVPAMAIAGSPAPMARENAS